MKMKEEITFSILYLRKKLILNKIRVSVTSPIGKALLGKKKNEIVEVQVPDGIIR